MVISPSVIISSFSKFIIQIMCPMTYKHTRRSSQSMEARPRHSPLRSVRH